jgi:hypothetical protein
VEKLKLLIYDHFSVKKSPASMSIDSKSRSDWQELLQYAQGQPIVIQRIAIPGKNVVIEGAFELPELARLPIEDQVFITAFLRSHGSIKEMEQIFGVSYPTIKARLNRIAGGLRFIDTDVPPSAAEQQAKSRAEAHSEILARLSRGEISAEEAVRLIEGQS